ncbi:hypothetical protein EFV37_35790 (plasmid) [Mesorhizobium loti]|uniref:Uncharacterized protein n=1 Tax=Mesorhizobium jarvisii TaxID=1777867 RepID=A0A6M7TRX9_9HYPH|nr:hypothetical protein A9K72_32200 [Mesorhizobium loti]QKC67615.1 hypothetical protein EB229_35790 [Mesorhizobium jarvisii]QKD13528.1 hypothetical protein EFV37_35790 [Mesorhizobium loti]RJT29367.1 hypothetical protein D3242_29275 [Mesorhizobium jarvisii]
MGRGRFIWRSRAKRFWPRDKAISDAVEQSMIFRTSLALSSRLQPLPLLRRWLAGLVGDSLSDRGDIGREVLRFNATAAQLASTIS